MTNHLVEVEVKTSQQQPQDRLKPHKHPDRTRPYAICPPELEDGVVQSEHGVPIAIRRFQTPDAAPGKVTIEISYGDKKDSRHAGRQVWYRDTPRNWPRVLEVLHHYMNDRDNLGTTFRDVPRKKRGSS